MKQARDIISDAIGYYEGAEPERDDKCADYILQRLDAGGYKIVFKDMTEQMLDHIKKLPAPHRDHNPSN